MIQFSTIQVYKWKEQLQKTWTNPKTNETIIFYTQSLWCRVPYKKGVYVNFMWKAKDPFNEQAELTNVQVHIEQYKNRNGKYITMWVIDNWENYKAKNFIKQEKTKEQLEAEHKDTVEKLIQDDKSFEERMSEFKDLDFLPDEKIDDKDDNDKL